MRIVAYQIIYCFYTGRRIVFLHGFQKKRQKTPRRALEQARRYHEDSSPTRKGGMHHDRHTQQLMYSCQRQEGTRWPRGSA